MVFRGLVYLHDEQWLLHRDLKPSNVLISSAGVVKLADFGFARNFGSPNVRMTPEVVTRWYRCPELLYSATQYTGAVDIWSAGCIFAELMLRAPLFPAESDMEQLQRIFAVRGTPSEESWPGVSALDAYVPFEPATGVPLAHIFRAASAEALNLLELCLALPPAGRCTAAEALRHAYFSSGVAPTPPNDLPRPERVRCFLFCLFVLFLSPFAD
jgi:cyclin-dependent kinase 7